MVFLVAFQSGVEIGALVEFAVEFGLQHRVLLLQVVQLDVHQYHFPPHRVDTPLANLRGLADFRNLGTVRAVRTEFRYFRRMLFACPWVGMMGS